jgi:NADPH2:quinone reductase
MKAWLLDAKNGIDTLRVGAVPDPKPDAGEALIDLRFAALNPADRYLAQGEYPAKPAFPHILGRDGIGTIARMGMGTTGFEIGDRVIILRSEMGVNRPGTFAEKVAVPIESLAPAPVGWSDEQAAGAALVYLTAWQALSQWGDLPPSIVLVTGASGGVGVASIQLAVAAGHTVVALSRSAEKSAQLHKLGAAFCLDPTKADWAPQLKELLGKRRVDLAVDNVGGSGFTELLNVMGQSGRISVVGRLAGPVPSFNTASLFFRRLKIGGVSVGDFTPRQSQAAWKNIVQTLNKSGAVPLVDSVFPFGQLGEAFARLEKGPIGKTLLKVSFDRPEDRPE